MRSLPPTGSPIPTMGILPGVAHQEIRKESCEMGPAFIDSIN